MGHPLRSTAAVVATVVMTGTGITAASAQTAAEPTQPDDAASSLVFNEIVSTGDTTDWAELHNTGEEPIDLSGFHFRDDDDDHDYVLPDGSVIEPGGYFVVDQPLDGEAGFDFGLGDPDAARLFAADGSTLLASTSWQEHAETSWGRCPDGDGPFEQTLAATAGAINSCEGIAAVQDWPGGDDVAVADDADLVGEDISGLYHQPGEDGSSGTLWAVENDGGTLFQLAEDDAGIWQPAEGWAEGRTLGYPDHEGTIDAEGVTMDGEGAIYAASERDNDAGTVSRPSVLRHEIGGDGETLTATDEWNLAEDFEGLGANQGLEGVTWVPDEWPTEAGFVDQSTGAAYDPAAYPDHNGGLFFVGVEGTGSIYAYALGVDGSAERIATIEPSLDVVAEVQFDAERDQLWAACDDACDGRITTLTVDDSGAFAEESSYQRPEGMENLANEGFAIAGADQCTDGMVPTFYADDGDADDHSLRTGTFPCPDSDDSDDSDDFGKPESPGRSGQAPGHTGEAPGRSGDAPGRTGQAPGHAGEAPGRSGHSRG